MRFRPGQPTEMWSDVPSHVTSVTTTTNAAIAIVRKRGMLSRSCQFGATGFRNGFSEVA